MIGKKTSLIFSGLLSGGLFMWSYIGNYRVCDLFMEGGSIGDCPFILTSIGTNLIPIIPFFLFSLITYKLRDEVYRAWLHFAYVWIPLSMTLIFFAPEYAGNLLYPVTKGSVAFASSALFALVSLLVIAWRYIVTRRNKN